MTSTDFYQRKGQDDALKGVKPNPPVNTQDNKTYTGSYTNTLKDKK